jgi:hypothetical protein
MSKENNGLRVHSGAACWEIPVSCQRRAQAPFSAEFRDSCAAAFSLCPLMLQKWAVHYFWPIQATLETRGRKISGAGAEWFKASRDEVLAIYKFVKQGGRE